MAGPLGEAVLQLKADATAAHEETYTPFVDGADDSVEAIKAAQATVEGAERPLAAVIEEAGKIVTALAAGKEKIDLVSPQQSASAKAAGTLKQSAGAILGNSPSRDAAEVISYLREAERGVNQAQNPLLQVTSGMDETIGMASELTEAVDTAAAILARLKQQLNMVHSDSVITSSHAWQTRDNTQIAVVAMDNYLRGVE